MPKSYPPEFKARVLALLKAGRSIQQVALELDLSEATMYTWRKQDEIDSGAGLAFRAPKRPNSRLSSQDPRARRGGPHPQQGR